MNPKRVTLRASDSRPDHWTEAQRERYWAELEALAAERRRLAEERASHDRR